MARNKKKNYTVSLVIVAVFLVAIVGLGMWIWSSSTKNTDGSGQEKENIVDDTSSKEDVSENLKEESEDVNTDIDENKDSAVEDQENATQAQDQIEEFVLLSGTPVGDLYYPQKWEGMVSAEITEDDGYAAKIYGTVGEKKFLLYTLYIGSNQVEGFVFGYVDDTKVAFKVEEIDMSGISEEDELALYGMQDEINSIMDQIRNLDGYNEEELIVATEDEKEDIVLLDTPIGPLNYPGRWENAVSVVETSEGENYTAEIFGNIDGTQIKLYTMYIGDNEKGDFQIGSVDGIEIGFSVNEIDVSEFSEEDQLKIYGIQEDINFVINQIREMAGYIE